MAENKIKKKSETLVWIAQIILLIGFLLFGIFKFLTPPEVAAGIFGEIGGVTSQYFTGAYEIISAILVIIPGTAFIGALMIVVSMTTAFILHLTIIDQDILIIFNIIFIILAIYVMIKRKKDLFWKKK